MNPAWRIVEAELTHRRKGLQWLADQMGASIQRVQNWTTRGIPVSAYPEVAAAFGESIDWIAGLVPPKRGAGLDEAPTAGSTLEQAIIRIGQTLLSVDVMTREAVAALLTRLALEPENADRVARRVGLLLEADPPAPPPPPAPSAPRRPVRPPLKRGRGG